jgi:hypothetical protein
LKNITALVSTSTSHRMNTESFSVLFAITVYFMNSQKIVAPNLKLLRNFPNDLQKQEAKKRERPYLTFLLSQSFLNNIVHKRFFSTILSILPWFYLSL